MRLGFDNSEYLSLKNYLCSSEALLAPQWGPYGVPSYPVGGARTGISFNCRLRGKLEEGRHSGAATHSFVSRYFHRNTLINLETHCFILKSWHNSMYIFFKNPVYKISSTSSTTSTTGLLYQLHQQSRLQIAFHSFLAKLFLNQNERMI